MLKLAKNKKELIQSRKKSSVKKVGMNFMLFDPGANKKKPSG
jgi:hypothetical protein